MVSLCVLLPFANHTFRSWAFLKLISKEVLVSALLKSEITKKTDGLCRLHFSLRRSPHNYTVELFLFFNYYRTLKT